jgi:hypothetical protein
MTEAKQNRPVARRSGSKGSWGSAHEFSGQTPAPMTVTCLKRRRQASLRCQPLDDGRRDNMDKSADPFRLGPSCYGLDPDELAAERRRLSRTGWRAWELAERFGPNSFGGGQQ